MFSCRATRVFGTAVMACLASALAACGTTPGTLFSEEPTLETRTSTVDLLRSLPPPKERLYAAVYRFTDQTGAQKPNDNFAEYSRAVTQGGAAILVNALHNARNWFTVIERESLPNLLQERQIIRSTRLEFLGPDGKPLGPVPALLNAGIILDGGIISYDSNTLTGGFGARYLGIGGNTQYRRDTIAVYLRAVATQNGQVVASVTTNKTVYSVALSAGAFRFISFQRLLEIEAGVTTNEPVQLAVKQAIEKAVHALIIQGAINGEWEFADPAEQAKAVQTFVSELKDERSTIIPVSRQTAQEAAEEEERVVQRNRRPAPKGSGDLGDVPMTH